jgi:hypothetical protein
VFDYERVVCKSNEDLNDSMFKCPEGLDLEYKRTSYLDPHEEFWCVSDKKCSEGFEENEDSGFCEAGLQVCPDGMSIDGISCIGETNDNCPAGTDFNPDSCEESSSLFCPPDDPALLTGRCEGDKVSTCPPGTSAGNSTEIKCSGPKLLQCPPGTYDDNGTCLVVPAGTFTDQLGSTVLNICPANGYCPEASVFPLPCPPGTTAPEGSSSADQCVPDIDGDSIADDSDNCPLDANTDQVDTDWDTLGNACDPDDDNDQQTDVDEISCGSDPLDETSLSPDNDGDFSPDCVDDDDDNDGVLDTDDSCPFEDATGLDADIDGCIDNFAGLADFIGSLASGGVMNQNLADPLIAKVENAVKSDAKDNICTAVNQLGAFKNQVEAKRGKQLPDDAADQLMQYADNIIIQLFAKLPEGESCK